MNEQNNLPPLDTSPEAVQAELNRQRNEELRPYWLDPREDYPEPYYMLEYNGVPFSTIGGIQAISGQKKNGKSFVLTQLMAAILGQGSERTAQYLPGLKVPERTIEYLGHQPSVLYVDTEMEKLNSAKVLRRVHWLCDWPMNEPQERFNVLWLKNMPRDDREKAHLKRWRLIRMAIEAVSPDIVFIDGIRDLLSSINDEDSGTQILAELATMAENRRMCIWNALHQNPRINSDGEDAKMRGWIGTELGNKVSDTFISIKSKNATGVTFTVKQQDARGKDLDDWKFEVTDDAGNLGVPRIISSGYNLPSKSKEQESDSPEDIRSWINEASGQYEWPMSRKDIKQKVFGKIGGVKNDGRQQADLMVAINLKYLTESTIKSGGYYMLQPVDDLPF
jgi:hypothetical protein